MKKISYTLYQKNISLPPQVIDELSEFYNNFTKIKVSELLPENQFLLDNKVYKRKAGYDVITPMLVNDKILLVNRGWVDGNNRLTMPDIDIATINTDVEGYTRMSIRKVLCLKMNPKILVGQGLYSL